MGTLKRLLNRGRKRKERAGGARILAYCASNIGLGHYGRLWRVLAEIKRRAVDSSILLVTDTRDTSAAAAAGIAVLRLPGFRFVDDRSFKEEPEALGLQACELGDIRAGLIAAVARDFTPDLLMMDTLPHGKRDELLPALRELCAKSRAKTLLMMRDIPCPPGEEFKLSGAASSIRKHAAFYDRILIAGDPKFFDPSIYGWPTGVQAKTRCAGFVVPRQRGTSRSEILALLGLDSSLPVVVASFGGGWEAGALGSKLIRGVREFRRRYGTKAQAALVTGPAISDAAFELLQKLARETEGVVVVHSVPGFPDLLAHADLAILHAGSTPFQILESDIPMVLTCRDYKSREQHERAERLARWPGIRVIAQSEHDDPDCAEWIARGLWQPRTHRKTGYDFDGLTHAADEALGLIGWTGSRAE